MSKERAKGSGYAAFIVGCLFAVAAAASSVFDFTRVSPRLILALWLALLSLTLVLWGANRIRHGTDDWTVGQPTINFLLGAVGATFALIAIL